MQPAVGQCQFGLPAGFGLSGWENSDPGETRIEGQCSSRGSRKAQTKSQSKAREGKERRGKRWREPGLDSSLGPVLSEVGKAGSLTDHLGVQFESRQPSVQPSAMSQQPNAACRWSSLENVLSSPCSGSGNCTDQLDPSPDSSPLHPPPTRDRPIDNDCPVSGRVFNPYNLMQTICRESLSARTALGQFCRESLLMQEASHVKPPPGRPLWPVPLPRWCWTPCKQLNPRRRRRNRQHRIRFEAVRLILACLNWEVLGHPVTAAPFESQLRCPISPAQHLIIEHLENLVNHHLCCGDFVGEDLGRFQEKYSSVIRLIQELPQCQAAGEDLESVLIELHRDMDPYHGHFGRGPPKHEQCHQPNADHECTFERKAHLPSSGARDVKSSRIKWQFPPSFEAGQFLTHPVVKAAFDDPEVMRKPRELWPKGRPAKMSIAKDELLALAKRWDDLGAIRLLPAEEKPWDEAVGIFAVGKDSTHDRLIRNPQNINGRMWTISESAKSLAPGAMLGLLHLEPDCAFRFSADDLSDFYYTFKVSAERAKRNAFRFKFRPSELSHLKCFDPTFYEKSHLLICLSTLAMGDNLAVEIAQQAHGNVLRKLCGSMRDEETLQYRRPVPRGDFIELLAIDDHVGIQRVLIDDLPKVPRLRDSEVFTSAAKAYKHVGLIQQEKKQKRNETGGIILGADFDGLKGRVMAPRSRILLLSLISMQIVRLGTITRRLLNLLVGCWVHVLLFRRVLFSVMDSLFKDGLDHDPDAVFCLSRQSLNELQILAMLGPVAQSDLRVCYSKHVYMTDASPSGGAVVRAEVGPKVSQEIWRHTEQKGFYTKLQSPISQILSEHGIEPESMNMFQDHLKPIPETVDVPQPLHEGFIFDCIELFRGTGNWSEAHVAAGLVVHDGIDLDGRRIRIGDITNDSVCRELLGLAARRVVRDWHAGVPCPSFGTLRRPQVRSKREPFGFDPTDPYTAYHNKIAQRTALVLILAIRHGSFVSVEQPRNSRLFHLNLYKTLVRLGCIITHFAFCAFGSGFHKPSKWLHNKPWLAHLGCKCSCKNQGHHFVVQGTFTRDTIAKFDKMCCPDTKTVYGLVPVPGERVSSFSAAYPLRLVEIMAAGCKPAASHSSAGLPSEAISATLLELGMAEAECCPRVVPEPSYDPRPWFEDPEWISELCECLEFKEVFRYCFVKPGHINVNETRTYKSWIKHMAKSERDSRFVGLLDSRVTLGASAKGRSSSFAISRVLQGCLGYVIGGNLYPGGLHCYSAFNRADPPSRGRPVEPPSKDTPAWLAKLAAGDPSHFDVVVKASCVSKIPGRWMRFILLILAGDIEENPGPKKTGPRPRGPLDLTVGFATATACRMAQCVDAFARWISDFCEMEFAAVARDPEAIGWGLRSYGIHLFERGLPRYLLVYAITGMADQYPICKPFLHLAWQIDRKWQVHEPGQCRAVLPGVAVRAMLAVATFWNWHRWVGVVLLGFAAMLHPSEMVALTRKDLVFPSDVAYDIPCLYIHLQNPKTARFARRQHGRIDDVQIIAVTECIFGKAPLSSRLFPGSLTLFRKQWDAVLTFLGVPHRQAQRGATPSTLRGSGATFSLQSNRRCSMDCMEGSLGPSQDFRVLLARGKCTIVTA